MRYYSSNNVSDKSVAMISVQAYNESLLDVASMIHSAFKSLTKIFH